MDANAWLYLEKRKEQVGRTAWGLHFRREAGGTGSGCGECCCVLGRVTVDAVMGHGSEWGSVQGAMGNRCTVLCCAILGSAIWGSRIVWTPRRPSWWPCGDRRLKRDFRVWTALFTMGGRDGSELGFGEQVLGGVGSVGVWLSSECI